MPSSTHHKDASLLTKRVFQSLDDELPRLEDSLVALQRGKADVAFALVQSVLEELHQLYRDIPDLNGQRSQA